MSLDAQRFTKHTVKATPTLHYNNLCSGGGSLCFTHGNQVHLVKEESMVSGGEVQSSQAGIKDSNHIYQAKFVTVAGTTHLVIGTGAGFQIWDSLGVNIVFNFNLPGGGKVEGGNIRPPFVRGITTIKTTAGTEVVCVGSSAGGIFCFERSGLSFRHTTTLTEHVQPVTDISSEHAGNSGATSSNSKLISADESGRVIIWEASSSSKFTVSHSIQGSGDPCVATVTRGDRLVCAYANGEIVFYNINSGTKWMEIVAHSRYLSSMTIHPTRDVFATCSEDTTLNVWTLPEVGQKAKNELSAVWKDAMICGVAFRGDGIAACAYDVSEIRIWT